MARFRDSRARPPGDKYGISGVSYPTPNVEDVIIVEDIPVANANAEPLDYGTPHAEYPSALLAWQGPVKGNGIERNWRRIYATKRNAQEAYNASIKYAAAHTSYPTFIRQSMVLRSEYVAGTMQQPLTAVTGLKLTAQGSGYPKNTTVTISGGGGTGATAKVTTQRGKVVAITLTNSGTGYTSPPTVTIAGEGGSGATAVATIQPQSAILVDEQRDPVADPQLASLFINVVQIYKTLPGFPLVTYTLDEGGGLKTRTEQAVVYGTKPDGAGATTSSDTVIAQTSNEAVRIIEAMANLDGSAATAFPEVDVREWMEKPSVLRVTTRKLVDRSTVPPQPKTAFRTGKVWESSVAPIPGTHRAMQTVIWSGLPSPYVEYDKVGFVFPALFQFAELVPGMVIHDRFPPPWVGDGITPGTYKLTAARQALTKARIIYTYSDGKSGKNYREYSVVTPGVASSRFPIPSNCIHGPFRFDAYENDGGTLGAYIQALEVIPASTPASYNKRQILVAHAKETEWHGGYYQHVLIQVSEETSPYDFPDVYDTRAFKATEMDTITQPASQQRLQLLSSNAADTMGVVVYGWRNTTYTKERVTLTGTTPVSTTKEFTLITHVRLLANAAGTVTVRGIGTGASGQLQFDAINEGDSVVVGITGANRTYIFRATLTTADDVKLGATVAESVQNLIRAINGTGTPGTEYSVSMVINPNITASLAEEPGVEEGETPAGDTIIFADKIATDYQRNTSWSITGTFTGTASTFNSGDNGATIATISAGKHAYRSINFDNPELLEGNSNEAAYNLPAFLNAQTDEIILANPGSARLRLCASGETGLACAYQRRATSAGAWSAPTTLPNLKDGTVHTIDLPGTTTRIRLHFYNGGSTQARKVHADVGYIVSV